MKPSAREMIEAEIEERKVTLYEAVAENKPHGAIYHKGALYGMRFALECLDEEGE